MSYRGMEWFTLSINVLLGNSIVLQGMALNWSTLLITVPSKFLAMQLCPN